ncbi:MAG: metallophosphoesterase [Deltaproteobacteria bacterium]|nr:metallophosphoesterase [Deltaproteobacteria bacterium]
MRWALFLLLCTGCASVDEPAPAAPEGRPIPFPTVSDAPNRLIAMGDVHGDFDAMMQALRIADLVDDDGSWVGGDAWVVQTGDQLDRGDTERRILDTLPRLADEAWAAGGAFIALNGNHEAMNVELDLRYVTEEGFADFSNVAPPEAEQDEELLGYPEEERGRVAAFRPGGPYAMQLSERNIAVIVGDSAFVHGGINPSHAERGLERINDEVQEWMRGEDDWPWIINGDGPLWIRDYSDETGTEECADLEESLAILGVSRLVVGHTRYGEINSACDEQVWRVDVGMASYYGGYPQVLEIRDGEVDVID